MNSQVRLVFQIFSTAGLGASIGQILIVRELLVVFCGNELSTGLILAGWLIWTAVGCWTTGLLSRGKPLSLKTLRLGFLLLAPMFPATLVLIRAARIVFSIQLGELIAPALMFAITLVSIAPVCFLSGGLFALGWNVSLSPSETVRERESIYVYLAETAGSAFGGILFYFVLMPVLSSFQISLVLSALFVCSAGLLSWRAEIPGKTVAISTLLLLCLIGVSFRYSGGIDLATRHLQWGSTFLDATETPYHNLAFLRRSSQFSLFSNGVLLYTCPDRQSVERSAHFPLLQHPRPEKVLLIGACSPELIGEILKHPGIREIDCVQPDSELSRFSGKILSQSYEPLLMDSRVHFLFLDINRFMRVAQHDYNVIILGSGEPVSAETNRFYTLEFFSGIRELMGEGGVFCFGIPCAPDIIGPREALLLQCLNSTLKEAFGSVMVLPCEDALRFFASKSVNSITKAPQVLIDRILARGLQLQYVSDFYLLDWLNPMRLMYVDSVLHGESGAKINRDFEPVCYMYALSLWGAQLHPAVGKSLAWISGQGQNSFLFVFFAFVSVASLVVRYRAGPGPAIAINVGICGAVLIITELALLLVYQIVSGSMYKQLALIISLFMSGMAVGGYLGRRITSRSENTLRQLFIIQAGLALYAALLYVLFARFQEFLMESSDSWMILALFLLLAVVAGILGGGQFVIAVCAKADRSGKNTAGVGLYAADLIGASGGALAGALFLMPVFGIPGTFLILSLAGFAGSMMLLRSKVE
jgi:spermidine synthase